MVGVKGVCMIIDLENARFINSTKDNSFKKKTNFLQRREEIFKELFSFWQLISIYFQNDKITRNVYI